MEVTKDRKGREAEEREGTMVKCYRAEEAVRHIEGGATEINLLRRNGNEGVRKVAAALKVNDTVTNLV